jgi:hypothetical protein
MPREQFDAALAAELAQISLGRFGSAEEIARAVGFLLSPESGYVVGETIGLAEQKLYVLPGRVCELPGYLRLSLTASEAMIERALPRFAQTLNG